MANSLLKKDELLTKISWYELGRKEGYVRPFFLPLRATDLIAEHRCYSRKNASCHCGQTSGLRGKSKHPRLLRCTCND